MVMDTRLAAPILRPIGAFVIISDSEGIFKLYLIRPLNAFG